MKVVLALALLAVLGFTTVGCGSGKKADANQYTVTLHRSIPSGPIVITGTATTAISNVKTGTIIGCKGWDGKKMRVPPLGSRFEVGENEITTPGTKPSGSVRMSLVHNQNGSITVSCSALIK